MKTFVTLILVICFLNFNSCARRVVVAPTKKVTIIKTPPKAYKIVKVKGNRYYYWNGKHYRKTRNGYVLVRV